MKCAVLNGTATTITQTELVDLSPLKSICAHRWQLNIYSTNTNVERQEAWNNNNSHQHSCIFFFHTCNCTISSNIMRPFALFACVIMSSASVQEQNEVNKYQVGQHENILEAHACTHTKHDPCC